MLEWILGSLFGGFGFDDLATITFSRVVAPHVEDGSIKETGDEADEEVQHLLDEVSPHTSDDDSATADRPLALAASIANTKSRTISPIPVYGQRIGCLFPFSPATFAQGLETGSQRTERQKEEMKARRRRKKVEKDTIWTKPGRRPLAEPPALNLTHVLNFVGDDARYRLLFPDDPGKRCLAKDLRGEYMALEEYSQWVSMRYKQCEKDGDELAEDFYDQLTQDLIYEQNLGNGEKYALEKSAKPLQRFEFSYLDPKGETMYIEESLKSAGQLNYESDEEVQSKYGYLLERHSQLQRFEAQYCDEDGGTVELEERLWDGEGLLFMENEQVRDKYGHLFASCNPVRKFEERHLDEDGGTTKLQAVLSTGKDPKLLEFFEYNTVAAKYGRLFAQYELQRFEKKYIDRNGRTTKLERALQHGLYVPDHLDVRRKYGALFQNTP